LNELTRKENESFIDYTKRLIDGKESGIYDVDKSEIYELIFGSLASSDHARKILCGIRKFIDSISEEVVFNVSDETLLEKIKEERYKLEKEKVKVRTEKIVLNQLLREEARFELFTEHTIDAVKKYGQIITKPNHIQKKEGNTTGSLIFSDPHFDKELKILGLDGETLNEYNPEIFQQRMWKMLNKTLHICDKEGFNSINVFDLGDDLEGMLRMGQLMSLRYGLVESAIRYSYFLASWLSEMSKYIYIDFYFTEGNHTDIRLLNSKKGEFPHENMGKMIIILLKEILRDNTNIIIHSNNTNNIYTKIQGFNILGVHGEEKDVIASLKDYSHIYSKQIDYIMTGHKHHANSISAGIRKGCIGVGSVIGIDEFSMKLKRVSDPTASFVIFEENIGKIDEKTIYLS